MTHAIQVFVAQKSVAYAIAADLPESEVVELTSELSLVPLTDDLFDAVCQQRPSETVEPFWKLNAAVLDAVLTAAGEGKVGYFETDYFGGAGTQAGALWFGGRPEIEPVEEPSVVNRVLRDLGVKKGLLKDEFDTVGLVRFRGMDDLTA